MSGDEHTANVIRIFDGAAEAYAEHFMDFQLYHKVLDLLCAFLPAGEIRVAELACGPGNISRYLLKQRPEIKLMGSDLAPAMLKIAELQNPGAEFSTLDMRDVAKLPAEFEGIICGFGLPYISREESITLIRDSAAKLKDGGVLYLSTMEGNYSDSAVKQGSSGQSMMQYLHEAEYLLTALEENRLDLVHMERLPFPEKDGSITTDLILIAKKHKL